MWGSFDLGLVGFYAVDFCFSVWLVFAGRCVV